MGQTTTEYESGVYEFGDVKQFIVNFTDTVQMGPNNVRQGYVEFAGILIVPPHNVIIGPTLPLESPVASSNGAFASNVTGLDAIYGSTNTPAAIDYARINMFTKANERPGAFRVAILVTDGFPTDTMGKDSSAMGIMAEQAAANLRDEDNVVFIFVRVGDPDLYPLNWFNQTSDAIYHVNSFPQLSELLTSQDFLCLKLTHRPTLSPIVAPSVNPTRTPSTAPFASKRPTASPSSSPTPCVPGLVHCCVSDSMNEKINY